MGTMGLGGGDFEQRLTCSSVFREGIEAGLEIGNQDQSIPLMESTSYSIWQTEICGSPFPFFFSFIKVIGKTSPLCNSEILVMERNASSKINALLYKKDIHKMFIKNGIEKLNLNLKSLLLHISVKIKTLL